MKRFRTLLSSSVLLATLALPLAGTAHAHARALTLTATAGPVTVPGVPVTVCVNSDCLVSTPPATTVKLDVSVTLKKAIGTPPTIIPSRCPAGQFGVVLVIKTGTSSVTISGSVTVTVNGFPKTIAIGPLTVGPNKTVTISACST